jgi:hypothetical protein
LRNARRAIHNEMSLTQLRAVDSCREKDMFLPIFLSHLNAIRPALVIYFPFKVYLVQHLDALVGQVSDLTLVPLDVSVALALNPIN